MAWFKLDIDYPDRPRESRSFTEAVVRIGRTEGELVLADQHVSRRHGELRFDGMSVHYVDLDSTSGTLDAAGNRVPANKPYPLSPGTTLRVGGCRLTLHSTDSQPAGAATPAPSAPANAPAAAPASASGSYEVDGPESVAGPQHSAPDDDAEDVETRPARPRAAKRPKSSKPSDAPKDDAETKDDAKKASKPSFGAKGVAAGGFKALWNGPAPDTDAARDPRPSCEEGEESPIDMAGFMDQGRESVALLRPHALQAIAVFGIVGLAAAVLNLVFGWIPVLGSIVDIAIIVARIVLAPMAIGAGGYYILKLHLGAPVTARQAWMVMLRPKGFALWLPLMVPALITGVGAILLLLPGIIIGGWMIQVFWVEGKRMHEVNLRCLELWKRDRWQIVMAYLIFGLAPAIVMALITAIVALLFGVIAVHLGSGVANILSAISGAAITALLLSVITALYFDMRLAHEGVDARDEAREALAAFEA